MGRWNRSAVTLAAVLALAACGGGGGGGTGATPAPTTPGTGQPAVMRQIQGELLFESIPTLPGGGLDYANVIKKPARGLMFEVRNKPGELIASGITDAQGGYKLQLLSGTVATINVFAALGTPDGKVSALVVDNTDEKNPLFGISKELVVGSTDLNLQDTVRSGWTLNPIDKKPLAFGERLAAPFAILDTIYQSQAKMLAAAPDLVFPPLTVFWSTQNTLSTTVNPATGQVGNSSFNVDKDGKPFIVLHGKPNVDTDEYDSSLIAHEWGHYFQNAFSRSDSPGGSHSPGDLLDPSLAFSEGWGTAWSGIALSIATYSDSYGPQQEMGLSISLALPPTDKPGWFNEASVAHVLWKLNETAGLAPIVQALRGPFRTVVASTGIHSFQASLREVAPAASKTMETLLQSQSISSTADAWGTGETNDGGLAIALPLVHALVAGQPTNGVCVSSPLDTATGGNPAKVGNKLGSRAYLRFSIATAGTYRFDLQGTAGSDPDWAISDLSGVLKASDDATPLTDTTTLELKPGDYLIAVREHQHLGASTCFTVKFQ